MICVDDVCGEILWIDAVVVTLKVGDETICVFNSVMVECIVVVEWLNM